MLLTELVAGGDFRCALSSYIIPFLPQIVSAANHCHIVISAVYGYFGKECFIKLAPFALVVGVGIATGR